VVAARTSEASGLAALRRGGTVTELLFLYECATLEPTQLRPIAERLGLTVQAVSHSFRQLRRRGLVTVREGRYRPTVEGVAWLHETLRRLGDDLWERIERVHVIRSTRAVALDDLAEGAPVSLELRHGLLSARPGAGGPSRGRVLRGGRKGTLIEVGDLEGIVPLVAVPISVRTLTVADLDDPRLSERVRRVLPTDPTAVVAADGLEAFHAVSRATPRPVVRFAAGAACLEASRVGVTSVILVLETELTRLLAQFAGPSPPALDVAPLPGGAKTHRRGH
jgi:predicted transcriptional regulator